jgi:hypothetical protein
MPGMKVCPRCQRELDYTTWFQDPVRICMVCYSGIRGNEQMTMQQLREKASKSRYARGTHGHSYVEARYRRLLSDMSPEVQAERAAIASTIEPDEIACEHCNTLCIDYNMAPDRSGQLWCPACIKAYRPLSVLEILEKSRPKPKPKGGES